MTLRAERDVFAGRIESTWAALDAGERGEAAEVMMAALKLNGVDRMWFVSGSELSFFQEAAAKAKALGRPAPQIVTMLHEHAALCAAMGDTMVSRKPSTAVAHVELGLLNMGGAIHNAYRGEYPVLIMTGVPAASYPGTYAGSRSHTVFWKQQVPDQGEIVRQYMKWDWKLSPYDNPGLTISRALQVATSPPTGPVYLGVPRESGQWPISGEQRFPTLDYLTPASRPAADHTLLRQAARLLIDAEEPVIVVDRAGRHPETPSHLVQLVELLGCPIHASNFRYNFPQPHPLRAPGARFSPSVSSADVVFVVDAPVAWIPGDDGPKAGAKVIWLDVDPIQQGIPIWEYPGDLRITADSSLAIPALVEEVRRLAKSEDLQRFERRRRRLEAAGIEAARRHVEEAEADGRLGHLTARWVGYQLAQAIDEDTALVTEGGYPAFVKRTKPGTIFSHGGASLGFGMAACLGGKLARPDQRFITTCGDGTYNFGLPSQVFWAAHHCRAPFVAVVHNNRGYSTGTLQVKETYPDGYAVRAGDYEGGFFDPPPDYAAEARAAGCHAERISRPADVLPALKRAIETTDREGVCSVLDMWLPKHITGEV